MKRANFIQQYIHHNPAATAGVVAILEGRSLTREQGRRVVAGKLGTYSHEAGWQLTTMGRVLALNARKQK